jgi:glucose-1-phosphate cytidylyltransferase
MSNAAASQGVKMKAVILAGGFGTRLSEETGTRPKPMVEIGGKPILWHIMKIYSHYGIDEFVICLGYKGYFIKEYFSNYYLHQSDVTFDLTSNTQTIHRAGSENWKVTLVETGENTLTGGRIRRIKPYVKDEEAFCLTYGDGVSDVDIGALLALHRSEGRLATVTAVQPPGRFGALWLEENKVSGFREKPDGDGGWINGGFFVCSPKVIDYIEGDSTTWEQAPLEGLARDGQLSVHRHDGFWQPMDSLRDKNLLEGLWTGGKAPWKRW